MGLEFKWNKNQAQIENDLGFGAELNLFVANTANKMMMDFIPGDSLTLAQSGTVSSDSKCGYVYYDGPYAHYQYIGLLMVAPNGSAWARAGERKHYASPEKPLEHGKDVHPLATSYWDRAMIEARREQFVRSIDAQRKRLAK